jgi:hypothetical protein
MAGRLCTDKRLTSWLLVLVLMLHAPFSVKLLQLGCLHCRQSHGCLWLLHQLIQNGMAIWQIWVRMHLWQGHAGQHANILNPAQH